MRLQTRQPIGPPCVLIARTTENRTMRAITKLLILFGLGATLSGCVVAPYGPRPYGYVAAPAPAVIVRPGYYGPRYYYGRRYY
jgi:hypothetical protein